MADTLLRVRQSKKSDVSRAFLAATLIVGVVAILGVMCVDGENVNGAVNSMERKERKRNGYRKGVQHIRGEMKRGND